jgi:hypothetical protein
MKVKFLVTCLFVFSHALSKIKLELLRPDRSRRLQGGLESIFPEFGNLEAGELSPEVAVKRIENLKERIYDIRDKLLQRLYLVRDYCGYHKVKKMREEALTAQRQAQEHQYMLNQVQEQSYHKEESKLKSKLESKTEVSQKKKEGKTSIVQVEEDDKEKNQKERRRLVNLVRELVREETEKLASAQARSHPQLHNFGKIGMDEENFDTMDQPKDHDSKFSQNEKRHHQSHDGNKNKNNSKKHKGMSNALLEDKILKKLGQA